MLAYLFQVSGLVVFLAFSLGMIVLPVYFAFPIIQEGDAAGRRRMNFKVTRGQVIVRLKDAQRDLERVAPLKGGEPRTFFMGGLWLPRKQETNHALVVGVTGTGKSILSKIQTTQALRRVISPLGDERVGAVVYDNKRELLPTLTAVVGPERLLILNPFHMEGIGPDVAVMFNTEARILQLAEACIEQRGGDTQPFWVQAGQDILASEAMVFAEKAPGRWTFRDLVQGTASVARQKLVLRQSEQTRSLIDTYLDVEPTSKNILATMRANLRDFRPVAASWHASPRTLNLKTFVTELGGVLVLQPSEEKRRAARATQKLFLELILQYALDLDDSEDRRLFFFLDEVQELGRIDLLPRALAVGRSKGLSFFIYTQTLSGLLKAYDEHDTDTIIANCGNQAYFALRGKTAQWGAEQFGQFELKREVKSVSTSSQTSPTPTSPRVNTTNGTSEQYQLQPTLFGSELANIRPPSREQGLTGVYQTRLTRPFTSTLKGLDRLLPESLAKSSSSSSSKGGAEVAAFVPRPDSEEVLKPWTLDDLYRLGLHLTDDDDLGEILGMSEPRPALAPTPEPSVLPPAKDEVKGKLRRMIQHPKRSP